MLRSRYFWFLITILLGVAGGLYLGWAYHPLRARTSFEQLRADYRTDLVLMVAENYHIEKNPSVAAARLQAVTGEAPLRAAQQAIISAGALQYSAADLALLADLAGGLGQLPEGAP